MASNTYIVSALKHRPTTFAEVLAQDHVTRTLKHSLERKKVANAFLFVGPRGTGKTTTARILAKALNCGNLQNSEPCNTCESCKSITRGINPDVLEIDAASNRSVEEMEDLRENVRYTPMQNTYKIYIIDEVHMLSTHAHNAFLKTLEEPPAHAKFILATTELHKIPETIISRCQRFQFRRIPIQIIVEHRKAVLAKQEEIEIADPSEQDRILYHLARSSEGGLRDALGLLDQLLAFCSGKLNLSEVQNVLGIAEFDMIDCFIQSVIQNDLPALLQYVEQIANQGLEYNWFLKECLLFLRNLAVVKVSPSNTELLDMPEEYCEQLKQSVTNTTLEQLLYITDVFWEAESRMRYSPDARLILELSAIKAAKAGQAVKIEDLLKKMSETGFAKVPSNSHEPSHPTYEEPHFNTTSVNQRTAQSSETVKPFQQENNSPTLQQENYQETFKTGKTAANNQEQAIPQTPNQPPIADANSISWQHILKTIEEKNPFLSAALHPSRLLDNDGENIKIAISPHNERYFKQARNKNALISILNEHLGKQFTIQFEVQNDLVEADSSEEEVQAAAPTQSKKELMEQIQQNESFSKLMTQIPGHIVDIQPETKRKNQ